MSKRSKLQTPKPPAPSSKPSSSSPPEPGTKTWAVVTVIAALIGALAVLLVPVVNSLMTRTQIEIAIQATSTAEAKLTQVTHSATPTPSQMSPSATAGSINTPTPVASATSTLAPTPACPYRGKTDRETLVNLISAEAEAVNKGKDGGADIIRSIFASTAVISDAIKPNDHWTDPNDRYRKLFETTEYKDVEHLDILPAGPGIVGNVAYFSSGGTGYWRVDSGNWKFFSNGSARDPKTRYGSDHWTFAKNSDGCWQIVRFVFDAGHIPFPP